MTDPSLARFDGVGAGYGNRLIFRDLDLDLPAGKIVALCGPNGSGKSTALRLIRRLMPSQNGVLTVDGRSLSDWSGRDLARAVAMLSQSPDAPGDMRVADLVMLGRYAHRKPLSGPSTTDKTACERAIHAAAIEDLADTPIDSLSGGQRQRAWIAMVLAQEAGIILLDEPTNHLDIAHALEVLELLRKLNQQEQRSVVVVLHDLNLAARYADHIVLFESGRIAAQGDVTSVMREDVLSQVFGIDCQIITLPGATHPLVVPYPRAMTKASLVAE
ncbi:ABC transporter ATP-binding protein [Qingshengfaniella alkalisoli]|uniref:ABC transporter ATP-binding protein n=1 Tax=Qingshengfaniella alkalisoli TaxID=2599296 RepID=A0A5B8IBZ9_9RHOB|nr:ABC transporter ATP-binding protein [Qingshengfaniella alkalisoli]QDY71046.1 ABC transporter ATP-binding protein [Qingshengfaniella alkalisoli]